MTPADARAGGGADSLLAPVREETRRLDPEIRAQMERSFGVPFGDVVVHAGAASARTADDLGASAFTVGRHIVFGPGRYDPASADGRTLLAHELAHVVQQRRGGGDPDAGERRSAAELTRGGDVHAGSGHADAGTSAVVGVARAPKGEQPSPATVPMFEYRDETGAVVRVPAADAERLRSEATRRMGAALTRVSDTAENWRESHKAHLDMGHAESFGDLWDKPSRIFGIASSIRAGVVPPTVGIWHHPIFVVGEARKALDAGNLAEAARLLRLAEAHLKDAKATWNTFLEATIGGAEKLAGELEVVRDTSFAIAIAAGGIVAAPVVAGAVAAAGATGVTATALTAAGTGAATMTGGAVLRGSADVAGQATSAGKVDAGKTWKEVRSHLKDDWLAGAGTGAAKGVSQAFGLAKSGLSTTQAVVRNVAAQTTVTAATGTVGTAGDTALAIAEGKSWEQAKEENLLPGLKSTAVSTVSAGASAPFGTLGQALGKGRPLTGKALEYGGQGVVAGGTTLAQGGTLADARRDALLAVGQGALMDKAQYPSGGATRPRVEPGVPTPPKADATAGTAPATSTPKTPKATTPRRATPETASTDTPGLEDARPRAPKRKSSRTAHRDSGVPMPPQPPSDLVFDDGQLVRIYGAELPRPVSTSTSVGQQKAPTNPTARRPVAKPAKRAAAPASPEPRKPIKVTPSRAKERAEAGERMRQRAQEKLDAAAEAETRAEATLTRADQRKAAAEAAITTREQEGRSPTQAQRDELRIAQEKHDTATRALTSVRASKDAAVTGLATAIKEAAGRTKTYEEARQRVDARKASARGRPGDAKSGPGDGVKAAWSPAAKKSNWKTFAAREIADRLAGRSSAPKHLAHGTGAPAGESAFTGKLSDWDPATAPPGFVEVRREAQWEGVDPIKALTDAELAHAASTGQLPARLTYMKDGLKLGPELEHRIPRRVAGLLAEAGVPVETAIRAAKLTDPTNLEPLFAEAHAVFDEHRNTGEARAQFDDRKSRPLSRATDAELAGIAVALKEATNPQSPAAQELRDALKAEWAKRSSAGREVP